MCPTRSSQRRCSLRKGVPRNFAKTHRKTPVPEACSFIKKETLEQVLCCKFCKVSKNTFSTEHLRCLLLSSFTTFTENDGTTIHNEDRK